MFANVGQLDAQISHSRGANLGANRVHCLVLRVELLHRLRILLLLAFLSEAAKSDNSVQKIKSRDRAFIFTLDIWHILLC